MNTLIFLLVFKIILNQQMGNSTYTHRKPTPKQKKNPCMDFSLFLFSIEKIKNITIIKLGAVYASC